MSKAQPRYDTASRTPRGRQNRSFRRGLVEGERGFPAKPLNPAAPPTPPVLSGEFGRAKGDPGSAPDPMAGSIYGLRTHISPVRLTNLESALELAEFWRQRAIALMEENLQLKARVVEAVAEPLRVNVVVKEAEP